MDSTILEITQPSLRRQLIAAIGMRYDPLLTTVSESDPAPDFGDIYVDPRPSLLELLKLPHSTLVFADYGMGKTATRLALEYALRNLYEAPPPLCVTYTPRITHAIHQPSDQLLAEHLAAVATEIAIDLIIQLIERQEEGAQLASETQNAALRRQAQALPIKVRRRMRDAATAAKSGALKNGIIWKDIRAIARYVAVTPPWQMLIDRIATAAGAGTTLPVSWKQTIADVQTLGFPQIYILIDAVDEGAIDREILRTLVTPLLDYIDQFHNENVVLKCFFPSDLYFLYEKRYQKQFQGLTVPIEIATITEVPINHLQAIVNERLQVAGVSSASYRSLDWLKGPDIEESIQARLAVLAQGSPRQMIELASQLLDFHARHGFKSEQRLWLNADEWQAFLKWLETLSLASP